MGKELTKQELQTRLLASGRPVTARQIERWSKAGHMVRPTRKHVPGTRGSISVFPQAAYEEAAALYDAAHCNDGQIAGDRRLDERAFHLWWSGKPIVHEPRRLLLNLAEPIIGALDRVRNASRTPVVGGDDEDLAFDIADDYFRENQPAIRGPLLKALFKNLGKKSEDLLSLMITLVTGALGGAPVVDDPGGDEPSLPLLVLRAFGFSEFKSELSHRDQVEGVFQQIALFADRKIVTDYVLGLSDDDVALARRCSSAVFEGLPAIFEAYGLMFGAKGAARLLGAYARMATATFKAASVIGAAWILRGTDRQRTLALVDQIEVAAPRAHAMCTLARAFPEYKQFLLQKNAAKLAALPEETRQKMVAILKPAMT